MRTKSISALVMCVLVSMLAGCGPTRPSIPPVSHVDLSRYMGRWYVIASIPTDVARHARNEVETYYLNPDGTICTWFRLRPGSFDAPVKLIHSTASVKSGTGNAQWSVHMYWVLRLQYLVGWLKPDYSQVMVVRDARDHLWYMARTPEVPASDYRAMLDRARAMGYDTSKIIKVPQRWPESGPGSTKFAGSCP
ncbi:MAG TPA: lipocalin family protein [Oleiagrimonas sp.]|nr:lipocalin family protein [Oleiagrimonas sp.]